MDTVPVHVTSGDAGASHAGKPKRILEAHVIDENRLEVGREGQDLEVWRVHDHKVVDFIAA